MVTESTEAEVFLWQQMEGLRGVRHSRLSIPNPDPRLILADMAEEQGNDVLSHCLRECVRTSRHPMLTANPEYRWTWFKGLVYSEMYAAPEEIDEKLFNQLSNEVQTDGYVWKDYLTVKHAILDLADAMERVKKNIQQDNHGNSSS